MPQLIEEPTFKGSYNPDVLSQLDIDDYFKNTHPQSWHPMEFVSKRRVESLAVFVTGLEIVGKIRSPPSAYARSWISFLKTEAGLILQRKALSVIVIRREAEKQTIVLTELQAGFSSATYGPLKGTTSKKRKLLDRKHRRDDDDGIEKPLVTPTKDAYYIADDDGEIPTTTEDVNVSSSFERAKSSIQESFPLMSLCKDNIADFCHSGELQDFMDDMGFSTAVDALPTLPNLPQDQQDMLDSLFEGKITMEGLSERIDDLMKVPNPVPALNRYIFTAFQPLRTAFMYNGTISQDINERHYFRDYVVELLRGALSLHGIPYMWGEIYVPAVSYRKANDADATGRGKFADGVSESEGHQILLSESSKLHRAPASKDQDDKMKLKRMLRDLFNFTILEMTKNKDRVKPNLKVFGSRTFKDTTELIAMDYHGMYRTYCLGSFKIVLAANNVKNLKECFEMCLRFSMAVKEQVIKRSEMRKLTDAEVIKLTKAARKMLTHTSFTPPKPPTQVSCSPSKQRVQQRALHKAQKEYTN
ncbi:hypothetical protein KI688_007904 [Linnemannia hyalina]|uniref:Uncharacterized protein n=1 Tax=Linnemannia hyalina TaxID=64524 RepID=A0A9P8BM58_9FUNG|nr:hypothetical protein KI688_007904 [Linnemannia hyalina]